MQAEKLGSLATYGASSSPRGWVAYVAGAVKRVQQHVAAAVRQGHEVHQQHPLRGRVQQGGGAVGSHLEQPGARCRGAPQVHLAVRPAAQQRHQGEEVVRRALRDQRLRQAPGEGVARQGHRADHPRGVHPQERLAKVVHDPQRARRVHPEPDGVEGHVGHAPCHGGLRIQACDHRGPRRAQAVHLPLRPPGDQQRPRLRAPHHVQGPVLRRLGAPGLVGRRALGAGRPVQQRADLGLRARRGRDLTRQAVQHGLALRRRCHEALQDVGRDERREEVGLQRPAAAIARGDRLKHATATAVRLFSPHKPARCAASPTRNKLLTAPQHPPGSRRWPALRCYHSRHASPRAA